MGIATIRNRGMPNGLRRPNPKRRVVCNESTDQLIDTRNIFISLELTALKADGSVAPKTEFFPTKIRKPVYCWMKITVVLQANFARLFPTGYAQNI